MAIKNKIQAAVLGLALMLPATSTFAYTQTYHHVNHHRYVRHRHHYSQTRGVVVGALAGAAIDHHQPLQGALVGAAVGGTVQAVRNHKQ